MVEREEEQITVDLSGLAAAIRRRARLWLLAGIVGFVLALAYQLWRSPQIYTATVSVAVQQPANTMTNSPFAGLLGQTPSRKYIGIIASRKLAEAVERKVHLKQFYGIRTDRETYEMLSKLVKAEDKPEDGLLLITVNLPAPPLMAADTGGRREQTRLLAAQVANFYVDELRRYFTVNDNERDTVLLRDAQRQAEQRKSEYEQKRIALSDFVRNLRARDTRAMPTGTGVSSATTAQELVGFYEQLAKVQTDIKAAEAAQTAQQRLIADQLGHMNSLPAEDPLLTSARERVNQEKASLDTLLIQYGPDNPRVRAARERLRLANIQLHQQEESVRQKRTTENVVTESGLEKLRATREALLKQIQEGEGRLVIRRELASELDRLQRELEISFEKRKNTEVELAKLQLSTVSGSSRLTIVDPALPPDRAQFSVLRTVGVSLGGAFAAVLVCMGLEGLVRGRRPKTVIVGAPLAEPEATAKPSVKEPTL